MSSRTIWARTILIGATVAGQRAGRHGLARQGWMRGRKGAIVLICLAQGMERRMARIWKIVRHGSPDEWDDSIPEKSLAEGQLVVLLGRLAANHLPHAIRHPTPRNAPRYTTSLTVKNDRQGNKCLVMYASGSRVHYIATLEEAS